MTKSFGGVTALDHVELTILRGEVHGLLGENGSGKSTLIKVLAGYHEPDDGSLVVNGRDVRLPLRAGEYRDLGFAFVHQDLGLIPTLSVTENLFLRLVAAPTNRAFMSWGRLARQAEVIFRRYQLRLDPRARVQDVRAVDRALLAIVRALEDLRVESGEEHRPSLLVLDEPTAFLPEHEIAFLFDFVRRIAASGSSVLFVSHDLDEVLQITDRITVLRDGHVTGRVMTAETTPTELVRLIIGHDLPDTVAKRANAAQPNPVMQVSNLTTRHLQGITFDLFEGEVLGVTGLLGSGYEDLAYALYGGIRSSDGSVVVDGKTLNLNTLDPRSAIEHGMVLVPGDRHVEGSVLTLSAAENINLPVLDDFFSRFHLQERDLNRNARSLMSALDVRPADPRLEFGSFSGGNQQKVMIAKWQQTSPRVLLLHEPTQGVDVGARQQIWSTIRAEAHASTTIVASSDYEQLAMICDRVLVIARGRLTGSLIGDEVTKERIADACMRGAEGSTPITAE